MYWGVKDLNTDDVGIWDATDLGQVIMDDQFNLSSKKAQQDILNFCADLKEQSFVKDKAVTCWLEDFDKWLQTPTN